MVQTLIRGFGGNLTSFRNLFEAIAERGVDGVGLIGATFNGPDIAARFAVAVAILRRADASLVEIAVGRTVNGIDQCASDTRHKAS